MKRIKASKRILAVLLSLTMVMVMSNMTVSAAEITQTETVVETVTETQDESTSEEEKESEEATAQTITSEGVMNVSNVGDETDGTVEGEVSVPVQQPSDNNTNNNSSSSNDSSNNDTAANENTAWVVQTPANASDLNLQTKMESVEKFADGFDTLKVTPNESSKIGFKIGLHMHVGKQYIGRTAYIFKKDLTTGEYLLAQTMKVNEIGNVGLYVDEMSEMMILISK